MQNSWFTPLPPPLNLLRGGEEHIHVYAKKLQHA